MYYVSRKEGDNQQRPNQALTYTVGINGGDILVTTTADFGAT